MKIIIISFFTFFAILFQINAQERIVHGIVTTFETIPVVGATVKVNSTKQVALTDSLGKFSVHCDLKDKLKISAKGFYDQNVRLPKEIKIAAVNLKLKPGEKGRAYAIGYGHVLEEDKLTAVSNLNQNDTDFSKYRDLYDVIRGSFSGVQVTNGEIIIRGTTSFNSSSAALIVLDGVISDASILNTISPIEVKSIDVLKDGGAAIYGSRGANGVVIIETKKGGDN
ncbi:MAG: TonB-dependent receptor plug domain-containing protein [Prolixibacteraceae bacterium]|jgi:TonB-dependent SusC/RagA subfamily outer membrane receptor|nr:TonB-dependent receptor plug domain-containing protein [Prolixibacteraceae bacterium]MBT6996936.1 TonB-dependent receptor plug domain-containing protein [Prolixibacteraceae bacterium]MBT7395380.1 TonB-dependent receptor plug domain-containing protein [Prolixibacteraceae bacterium]